MVVNTTRNFLLARAISMSSVKSASRVKMEQLLGDMKMQQGILRETISNIAMKVEDTLIHRPLDSTFHENINELTLQKSRLAALNKAISKLEEELGGSCVVNRPVLRTRKKGDEKVPKEAGSSHLLRNVAIGAGITIGAGVAVALAPAAIAAAGFTPAGVAAGTLAAKYQAAYLGGIILKGSWFALSQSAGSTGLLATSTLVSVGAAGGATGGAVAYTAKRLACTADDSKGK